VTTGERAKWERVQQYLDEALDLSPESREALATSASTDPVARAEAWRLLGLMERADRFFATPAAVFAGSLLGAELEEPDAQRIGNYRVVRVLGRGGMGQVLLARRDDGSYEQEVAIKLVRRGMDSEDVLGRFRAERQILASLTHPNIARLLDGGITVDGRPYFVLEFVPGLSITEHCEHHALPIEARLRLFASACAAVQHAHDRGIVHRDLKPSNMIVAEAASPQEGTVKLLDFGIAKVLDAGGECPAGARTLTGFRLMTPEYASPEQLGGREIGPASDVYSLGTVLYELLAGRRPYEVQGLAPADVERIVCHTSPAPLSRGGERLPAALESIVLMAIRKEPERRYSSAGELGDDIQRFLGAGAVRANGDSLAYRVSTFLRRRTVGLALIVAAAGVAVGIAGGMGDHSGPSPMIVSATADPLVIAVLPFRYTGPEGQEYFADGLADMVNAHLAVVLGLAVVPHSRAVQYRGTGRSIREIGAELGVTHVLDGTVLFENPTEPSGRIILVPRVVRVADDRVIWTRAFDQRMERFFDLQAVVAREVAQSLKLAVTDVVPNARSAAGAGDLEAYRFYLRGNEFLTFNQDELRLRLAEASYLQAVARDSTFAEAWAKLSATHTQLWFHRFDPSDDRLERARDAADRALRHHPELPESYYALGLFLYQGRGDLHQAQRYFRRALELQPNHVGGLVGLANVLRRQGRMEEALSYFQQLILLDPLDASHLLSAAFTQQLLRNYAESEQLYVRARRLAPDLPLLYALWARGRLSRTGSAAEARSVLEQGEGGAVDNDFTRLIAAELDLMSGRYGEVLSRTAAWNRDVLDTQVGYVPVAWLRAAAHRGLGDFDNARVQEQLALRLLEERVRSHPADGRAHGVLGRVYATLGRHAEAVRFARLGVELQPRSRDAVLAPFRMEDLAAVYVLTGQADAAIDQLEVLLSVPGLISPEHLHADPFWAPLKKHPRFPPAR
jgi:eukaryotic-like serine/threonine-protein kinase